MLLFQQPHRVGGHDGSSQTHIGRVRSTGSAPSLHGMRKLCRFASVAKIRMASWVGIPATSVRSASMDHWRDVHFENSTHKCSVMHTPRESLEKKNFLYCFWHPRAARHSNSGDSVFQ